MRKQRGGPTAFFGISDIGTDSENNMNEAFPVLDARLKTAASFVRENAVVADIGTDHAYLPVYLVGVGRAAYSYACDINRGPLEKARETVTKYGAGDKVSLVLSDGLASEKLVGAGNITDIVICGMGGELIERILKASPLPYDKKVRLILQPMTFAHTLREFLLTEGFDISDERLCKSAGRVYTVICAEYDGVRREYSGAELYLGKKNLENREPLLEEYTAKKCVKLKTVIDGKKRGGLDCKYEEKLLDEIERISVAI